MADYELVAVARTPASSGAPTLAELDRLVAPQITWTDELTGPGAIAFSCDVNKIPDDVKARLRTYQSSAPGDITPLEVWLYRDDLLVAAGIVYTFQIQGDTLTATCPGLEDYLRLMWLTATLSYSAVDQLTIAKALVDHWQALTFGHFGIDTSGVGTSGVTRDRTYPVTELHQVSRRIRELGDADDGFDIHVDPLTRDLVLSYPQRGSDLSADVFLDQRNVTDASLTVSAAPGDLASDVLVVGTGSLTAPITATDANTATRAAWGRSGATATFDGVSTQPTLDGHAAALLAARDQPLVIPAPGLLPVSSADVGDFGCGDTVTYDFDGGLGRVRRAGRVATLQVTVADLNQETMAVGFA